MKNFHFICIIFGNTSYSFNQVITFDFLSIPQCSLQTQKVNVRNIKNHCVELPWLYLRQCFTLNLYNFIVFHFTCVTIDQLALFKLNLAIFLYYTSFATSLCPVSAEDKIIGPTTPPTSASTMYSCLRTCVCYCSTYLIKTLFAQSYTQLRTVKHATLLYLSS